MTTRRAELAQGFRELAQFIEDHPEAPLPFLQNFNSFIHDNAREKLTNLARSIGDCKKVYDSNWFNLRKEFSGGITLDICTSRENICERVVAKKFVPARVIPAQPEQVIPEHEEEVVEWHCPDALLTGGVQ